MSARRDYRKPPPLWAWILLTGIVVAVFAVAIADGSDGPRVPGSWPKPAEQCTTANRGVLKWVHDMQMDVWVKWRCRCNIGAIAVCKWQLVEVRKRPYIRVQLPNGTWHTPAGWHKHLHLVVLPMAAGGYCGYLWPVWHFIPERLR